MYKYPKKIMSIDEQIQSYKTAGMKFKKLETVRLALETIGFYRLRGYIYPFYDNNNKKSIHNSTVDISVNGLQPGLFDHSIWFSLNSKDNNE